MALARLPYGSGPVATKRISDLSAVSRPPRRAARAAEALGRACPWWLAACVLLAVASLLGPSVPNADPWGWVIWGREIDHGQLNTIGYPSWKPLAGAVTALLNVVGAAPDGWLVVVRAAGIASMGLAYRIAARYGGAVAGLLAAGGLLLFPGWLRYLAHGTSEPLLIAFTLGAVDAHVRGRKGLGFSLLVLAGWLRPEVWAFALGYAVWWRPQPTRVRAAVGLSLAVLPVVWFLPDWLGSGDPLHGAKIARLSAEAVATQGSGHPLIEVLRRAALLVVAPLVVLAAGAAVSAWRRGERAVLAFAYLVLGWVAIVLFMTTLGYAGLTRFLEPAGALVCVLGGIGAVRLTVGARSARLLITLRVLVALAALPFIALRAQGLGEDMAEARSQVAVQRELGVTVQRLGGARAVLACGNPTASPTLQTTLAWILGVATDRVESRRTPAIVFDAATDPVAGLSPGRPAPWGRRAEPVRALLTYGHWRVLLVGSPARPPAISRAAPCGPRATAAAGSARAERGGL